MTAELERVYSVFEQALSLSGDARIDYLNESCEQDLELRREVEELLQSAERETGAGFLEPLPFNVKSQLGREDPPDPLLDSRLGPYQVRERIGQGGMGNVYLAARVDDYEQFVAIKVIKRGMDTEQILRRFRHEMQFSAALSKHPNIAALQDAGTTGEGLPYFVMEYVDGDRIDRYCDQNLLPVPARLHLFRQVCAAVQFAHQRTVVHRDLKPSNILVTAEGIPKLIDFGIAKLTDPEAELGPVSLAATETEQRLLTPEYASPEQVRGEPLTTATDVYSLGVVLYELLTGRKPYRITTLTSDSLRVITETAPPRPSQAVLQETAGDESGSTTSSLSELRGEPPRRLHRTLCGDLDNIVLMALRKEPERRYASVEQLSADIDRYLKGLPVSARADTWRYRSGKFLKRNRLAVASATLLLLSLIGGIVGSVSQAIRANRQAGLAAEQAALADQQAAIAAEKAELASAINRFLVEDFIRASDAYFEGDPNQTLHDAVRQAGIKLRDSFDGHPETKAALHTIVGESLMNLGLPQEAIEQLDLALDYYTGDAPDAGRHHPEAVRILVLKGSCLDFLEQFDEAIAIFSEAIGLGREMLGEEHPNTIHAMAFLGETLQTVGRHAEAVPLLQSARDLSLRFSDPTDHWTYIPLNSLAASLQAQDRYDEAQGLYEQLVQLTAENLGKHHPDSLQALNQLASLHYQQSGVAVRAGDPQEQLRRLKLAEPLFAELNRTAPSVLPERHPDRALYLGNHGVCLSKLKRFSEAEPNIQAVCDIVRQVNGEDSDHYEFWMNNLLRFYQHWASQSKPGSELEAVREKLEACARQRIALRVMRADRDTETGYRPQALLEELLQHAPAENSGTLLDSILTELSAGVPENERRANYLGNLGRLLLENGRSDDALALLLESYQLRHNSLGMDHDETQWILRELVDALDASGRGDEAEKYRALFRRSPLP